MDGATEVGVVAVVNEAGVCVLAEVIQGKVGAGIAQRDEGLPGGRHGVGGHELVVLVQVADGPVLARIGVGGVEAEITLEILEGDVFKNLVCHLVVDTVLIGLGHLGLGVGDFDPSVVGQVGHVHRGVGRAGGGDHVADVLGRIVIAVRIGILEEILVAAMRVLWLVAEVFTGHLVPEGRRHGTEVRQSPEGFAVDIPRCDAGGLGHAGGQVVVGGDVLDGGELLQRVVAPVLIQVDDREAQGLPAGQHQREDRLPIGDVTGVIVGLLLLAAEVLGDLHLDGKQ